MNRASTFPRPAMAVVVLAILALTALLLSVTSSPASIARAQDEKDADIIVQFGDTDVAVRAITFTTPISGLTALQLTGMEVITTESSLGVLVCSINGVGCPADNCFCSSRYWGYNYWADESWQSYMVGASGSVISQTGAIEGWRWGEWTDPMVPAPRAHAGDAALGWLRNTQAADGGFGGSSATAETMIAMGANRLSATDWISGDGMSLMDYWAADAIPDDEHANNAAKFAAGTAGNSGKLIVAAAGLGEDLANFAGIDLSNPLASHYNKQSGVFGDNNWDQTFGMLGWSLAYTTPVPSAAVDVLASRVISDGGWGWAPTLSSDTNSTAIVIQALLAANQCTRQSLIADAVAYLHGAQNDDGGFPYAAGDDSDANSTAFVIQAITALGQDPASAIWTVNGKTPYDFLTARQLGDGGVEWMPGLGANLFATQQAVLPLLNGVFPLRTEYAPCGEVFLPVVNR